MIFLFLFAFSVQIVPAQRVEVRPAEPVALPSFSDSNSPAFWWNGSFRLLQSTGLPVLSVGSSQFDLSGTQRVWMSSLNDMPVWIESVWVDEDGTVFGWYHNEELVCGSTLSKPRIGAVISRDGGGSFVDLGIVLDGADPLDCSASNGYFAAGHGDFTVLLDSNRQHFYFYFGNYGGDESSQGIAVGRLAFEDRFSPSGRARKYYNGSWNQPGLGGHVTPMLPATVSWNRENTDAFWGPSLHWNYHLGQYVMLLTRSCCEPGWPTEGTYISFNPDLSDVNGWSTPQKILDAPEAWWYPQVIGLDAGASDREAGQAARLYISGTSNWELIFSATGEDVVPQNRRPQAASVPSSRTVVSR